MVPMNPATERAGFAYAAIVIALWSGFVLVSRIGGTSELSPLDITALRFGTAALVLLPTWLFWKRVPLFNLRMLALALIGGIGYSLSVYAGFHYAPGAHGALLVSGLLPFMLALFVWLLLGETPRRQLKYGLLLIAAGVGCLAFDTFSRGGEHGGSIALGDALLVTASLCWALYTVLIRRWGYQPWETTIGVALLAGLLYLPVYVLLLPSSLAQAPMMTVLLQAIYQGVFVVIIAMVLYMQALVRLGPARLGAMMAMVPAIAGTGVSLVLGEPLTAWLIAGLLLTSSGAWVGVRVGVRK